MLLSLNFHKIDSSALDLLSKPDGLHMIGLALRGELRGEHVGQNQCSRIVLMDGDYIEVGSVGNSTIDPRNSAKSMIGKSS